MIESITYTPVAESLVPWATDLPYFQRTPTTQFKPGLNILFGANGSGKSTLLHLLALSLAAAQGGTSVVTTTWMSDIFGWSAGIKLPCDVVHDGQPIMSFDARATEGLIGGGFDDDFFQLGFENTMARGSSGERILQRADRMLAVLVHAKQDGEPVEPKKSTASARTRKAGAKSKKVTESRPIPVFPKEVEWRVSRDRVNSVWADRVPAIEKLLAARCPQGPQTMLFDEPESGCSLQWQAGLWRNLFAQVDPEKYQLIIATHSPFALGLPNANYIELSPGYVDSATEVVKVWASQMMR